VSPQKPIVREFPVKRAELRWRAVRANVALVLATEDRGLAVVGPGQTVPWRKLRWNEKATGYEVDMGVHQTNIQAELPSSVEAFGFDAKIDTLWRVRDAIRFVTDGVRDVGKALMPIVCGRLRDVSRRFPMEQAANAERAANESLREHPVGREFGLEVTAFVRLAMDSSTKQHAANTRGVEHYRQIITAGDADQFALVLAQRPNDFAEVLKALNEERDQNRRLVVDFVNQLVSSGAIDRWEIDEQVRTALDWLRESTDHVIRIPDEARPVVPRQPARQPAQKVGNGAPMTRPVSHSRPTSP
jgi:hypothetical protein